MRQKIVAGNWKMNTTLQEGIKLAQEVESLAASVNNGVKIVLCTPFVHMTEVKKVLKKAPKIGEADSDKAKVYVSIKDLKDNKIYHAIEYTVSSDTVFCLVDKDGDILWEEHSFTALFSNEQTVILKGDEYKDIYLDVNGKVLAA